MNENCLSEMWAGVEWKREIKKRRGETEGRRGRTEPLPLSVFHHSFLCLSAHRGRDRDRWLNYSAGGRICIAVVVVVVVKKRRRQMIAFL